MVLNRETPDWVIVDHYGLPIEWEEKVLQFGVKLLVIDDIFRVHHCTAMLDQNFHSDHESKLKLKGKSSLFLGPSFALLSDTFLKKHAPKREFGKVKEILAFFGGGDPSGETLRFVKLVRNKLDGIKIRVVVGKSNPYLDDIKTYLQSNMELIVQTSDMASLMSSADLYVGAGGSTTWERCYMGLPALTLAIAENQEEFSENLDRIQVHRYGGRSDKVSDEQYWALLKNLIDDPVSRKTFSENSLSLKVAERTNEILNYLTSIS
jgi:UDP-2,4-diacetamido-2,4,6-trideoxy-beta-L-altropyranose hydrolase